MKTSTSVWFLALLAALLIAAHWYARHQNGSSALIEPLPSPATLPDSSSKAPLPPSPHELNYDWSRIESEFYKEYVNNLRAVGFPEDLIREIVMADVAALYEPREEALRFKPVAPDAPYSVRHGKFSSEDWDRVLLLREVRMEKQAMIKEILGIYVPREFLRGPGSRNYESYEYALGLLPEEKRNAAQFIIENEIIADAKNQEIHKNRAEELEAYARSMEERNAALRQILTPEEFELYHMNTTPAGTELARQIIGMEPTDEEFTAMFRHQYDAWLEAGGVFGRWRAQPVPREQISAVEQQLQANFKEVLGPDRYLDYQMATSSTGQQLRNFAARYFLPQDTLAQAFQLQHQAEQMIAATRSQRDRAQEVSPQVQARVADLHQQTERILGPILWQAWTEGRNARAILEP